MKRLLIAGLIALAAIGSRCRAPLHAKDNCRIELSSRVVSAFPGVWNGKLTVKTTLELKGERIAILALFDEAGNRVSYAEWEPQERTRWTVWRDLGLGAGEYVAAFATEHCRATDRLVIN